MDRYCQFCPIAKAAEILCEKWVILVLRELMMGSKHFNDFRRGLPKISPTILSRRLKTLEEQGVIIREQHGKNTEYHLTDSGEELRPIIIGFGEWGHRWAQHKITKDDLDAGFLLWDMRRRLKTEFFKSKRVVINIEFTDQKKPDRYWWMMIDEEGLIDLCFEDTGHEPDIIIKTTLTCMTNVWLGYTKVNEALKTQDLTIYGQPGYVKNITKWLGGSSFAKT